MYLSIYLSLSLSLLHLITYVDIREIQWHNLEKEYR